MSIVFTVAVWMWRTKAQIKSKQILHIHLFSFLIVKLISYFLTFRLRMEDGWASLFSMTCMSCTVSSPSGRGRVTSSATSCAASSNCQSQSNIIKGKTL